MAKKTASSQPTPLMRQHAEMKRRHPDAILLFRVGDFYELYGDDADAGSRVLGLTLTKRSNGAAGDVHLAGFPHHALDAYLPRLVRAGLRVAICEQLEDPKLTRKLVKRGITELVTPGVAVDDNLLQGNENNFLAALHQGPGGVWGMALLDISTGEFMCAQGQWEYIDKLMTMFGPKETLILRGTRDKVTQALSQRVLTFELDDWVFADDGARERLLKQFGTASLKGFGVSHLPQAIVAAGAVMAYLDITNHTHTAHITSLVPIDSEDYVRLDRFTIRNLELTAPLDPEGKSLLEVLDHTLTPMGARMLHQWIMMPLRDAARINDRLDAIEQLLRCPDQSQVMAGCLERMGDLGRMVSKISTLRITPRETVQLCHALQAVQPVLQALSTMDAPRGLLGDITLHLDPCPDIVERIASQINDDAPVKPGRGDTIRTGVNAELDEYRRLAHDGRRTLDEIKRREIEATGITSLKINFNNVFGYYIEVTNTHRDKVPAQWVRKQTLVNAERYITPELKEYEEKIMRAQERIESLETSLYNDLVAWLSRNMGRLQANALLLARLDCLLSLTLAAREYHYVRPAIDPGGTVLTLTNARHPVIERCLPPGQPYVANSVELDNDGTQIMMLTGPNMSGKSALLRQTALNVIMAQAGSFVAAEAAHIGLVDKIFTRVGASDNISSGESTFMVEMNEAAAILNNMTPRSLILFDELGRGTSTYDGISIAWAIVEHLHSGPGAHPKTLFATHYHELNDMAATLPRISNYHIAVRDIEGRIIFLRTLEKGGSEHSFGIHVARLAGVPRAIVDRAARVLQELEGKHPADETPKPRIEHYDNIDAGVQLSFFQLDDPVLSQIRDTILHLDINNLTPMDALNRLNEIKSILTGK